MLKWLQNEMQHVRPFTKWANNDDFDFDIDTNNDLTLLKYNICTVHLSKSGEKQENVIYMGLFQMVS